MKISDLSESITSAGSVAAVPSSLGKTQRRKTESKKKTLSASDIKIGSRIRTLKTGQMEGVVTGFEEKNGLVKVIFKHESGKMYATPPSNVEVLESSHVNENDIIISPNHGKVIKTDHKEHSVEMALSDLYQAAKSAKVLYDIIKRTPESDGIEGWVQEKIIKANDYLGTIREYLEHRSYMSGSADIGEVNIAQEAYDPRYEHDVMYRYDPKKEKLLRDYISHAELDRKKREGWRISPELAMKAHGYIPSKYKQGHFVKREGDKWVTVNPYADESKLNEKAVSKQQQKFMGMVRAAQKGETPASKEVADVAKSMKPSDTKKFASTKHKGLPKRK